MEEVKVILSFLFLFLAIIFLVVAIINSIRREMRDTEIYELTMDALSNYDCSECSSCESEKIDYETMSVSDLKKIAKERGIEKYYNLKKKNLVKALSK